MITINIKICGVGEMPFLTTKHSVVRLRYHGNGKDLAANKVVEGSVDADKLGKMLADFVKEVEEYKNES